jgi:hypothetical protein
MSERALERRQLQKSDVKQGPWNKKGNGPFLVHLASQGNRCASRLNWVTISFPCCELAVSFSLVSEPKNATIMD